jgi:glycerol-3-phosphate responsive antiterminator
MYSKIKKKVKYMENEEPDLLEALDNRSPRLLESVKDRIEAVRLAGGLLAKDRVVKDKYIEAMVNVTRELDPYAVIALESQCLMLDLKTMHTV